MSVSVTSPEQLEEYLALLAPDPLPFDLVDEDGEEEAIVVVVVVVEEVRTALRKVTFRSEEVLMMTAAIPCQEVL